MFHFYCMKFLPSTYIILNFFVNASFRFGNFLFMKMLVYDRSFYFWKAPKAFNDYDIRMYGVSKLPSPSVTKKSFASVIIGRMERAADTFPVVQFVVPVGIL